MTLTAQWKATTCVGLLAEIAPITRVLPGGYKHIIGRINWAGRGPQNGAEPIITLTGQTTLAGDDLSSLQRLIYDAYAAAYAITYDAAQAAWDSSPEAAAVRSDLDAGTPPAETCILPAAWDPSAAIALTGRESLDEALTQAAEDTAYGWQPIHTSRQWTVTWSRI